MKKNNIYKGTIGAFILFFAVCVGFASATSKSLYRLYVASSDMDQISQYDGTTGEYFGAFANFSSGTKPVGMTCGPDGNLYVTMHDSDKVVKVNGITGEVLGNFATSNLNVPFGIKFGPRGYLYVANRDNYNVVKFTPFGVYSGVFASGNGLSAQPFGIEFDSDDNLYVAAGHRVSDTGKVIKFDSNGDYVEDFATVEQPRLIAFGPHGNLFVPTTITSDNKVLEYASDGTLVRTYSSGLYTPHGVAIGLNGNLFVSEVLSHEITELDADDGSLVGIFASYSGLDQPFDMMFGAYSGICNVIDVRK